MTDRDDPATDQGHRPPLVDPREELKTAREKIANANTLERLVSEAAERKGEKLSDERRDGRGWDAGQLNGVIATDTTAANGTLVTGWEGEPPVFIPAWTFTPEPSPASSAPESVSEAEKRKTEQ